MHGTRQVTMKTWIVIFLSAAVVNCQETVLKNVSFHSIDGPLSGIPLFELKTNLQAPYAMCYPNSTNDELVLLSLTICQQLGFDALQRYFPIDAKLLGSESTRGFLFNADCNDHQLEQGFCPWKYFGIFDCEELLAVECAECNYVHHTADEELQEISIPAYVSCFTNTRCQWDIVNKHPRQKKIVLEFWKESANSSNGGNSSSEQVLEVRWLNLKLNNWALLQMTLGGADNMDPIKILTSNVTITYSSEDCNSGPRRAASIKFYAEDLSSFGKQTKSAVIMYALVAVFLLALVLGLIACICCYFKRRDQSYRRRNTIHMSYIPGLTIEEDGYIEEPTQALGNSESKGNPMISDRALLSESAESEKMLFEDGNNSILGFRPGRSPLARDILQPAAERKGTRSGEADEIRSCTSMDSLRSYYSVYQSRRTSRTESFLSTMSNSPPCYMDLNHS